MKSLTFVTILVFLFLLSSSSIAGELIDDQIKNLEPIIGGYPPNIKNEKESNAVNQKYICIKEELDQLLKKKPDDEHWLYMRGHLQSMGHNFNYPGAWQGATDDLLKLLKANPSNIPAIIELATLWVNSYPNLAPDAETLFRGAQCYNKKEPLEAAQKGIFFALYYQGKMREAFRQTEYLTKTWPKNEEYRKLKEMAWGNLVRTKQVADLKEIPPEKLVMATCNE